MHRAGVKSLIVLIENAPDDYNGDLVSYSAIYRII